MRGEKDRKAEKKVCLNKKGEKGRKGWEWGLKSKVGNGLKEEMGMGKRMVFREERRVRKRKQRGC